MPSPRIIGKYGITVLSTPSVSNLNDEDPATITVTISTHSAIKETATNFIAALIEALKKNENTSSNSISQLLMSDVTQNQHAYLFNISTTNRYLSNAHYAVISCTYRILEATFAPTSPQSPLTTPAAHTFTFVGNINNDGAKAADVKEVEWECDSCDSDFIP